MKLGNVSQSIIPVPKFFLNHRTIDLFTSFPNGQFASTERIVEKIQKKKKMKKSRNKSYYRVKDVLSINCDININLNPRYMSQQAMCYNTKKYIPLYHRDKYKNNAEAKGTYFPDIIDMNPIKSSNVPQIKSQSNLQKYKEYKKKINIEEIINPDLRNDIVSNTNNLLKRINMNYDIKKWGEFDCRTTFNRFHQTAYSPLTDVIKNSVSEKDAFNSTLRQKALTLRTISNKAKESLKRSIQKKDFSPNIKNSEEKINYEKKDILLKSSPRDFLRLSYNNNDAPEYNKKDKKFIIKNIAITNKINKTKLYSGFPSSTREEFNKIEFLKKNQFNSTNYDNKRKILPEEKCKIQNSN
jgi:hypothetical protein